MTMTLQVRNRLFVQPADEFEQRGQIGSGQQAAGHLATEIGVNHPVRNGLTDFGAVQIQILHAPAAEFAHDREVMLTIERMKRIPNRNFALVTGIIAGRLKPVLRTIEDTL
jgi:hypothetical protein